MNKEQYVAQVAKYLTCKKSKRKEITDQLASDIESALEQGEQWDSIEKRLGTPEEMAVELNENLDGNVAAKPSHITPGKKAAGILVGIALILCLCLSIPNIISRQPAPDSATPAATTTTWPVSDEDAIKLALSILENYNRENYPAICELCNEQLKSSLTPKALRQTRKNYLKNAGDYKSRKQTVVIHQTEKGTRYTIVQCLVSYENQQVVFTITMDENKKLAGFYMK